MITPQAAFELAHGRARIPSFVEMARPGPQRPMPAVAGMQRSQVEAMMASSGPPVGRPAGPQQTPITQPAGVNGLARPCAGVGCNQVRQIAGLGAPTTWPMWAKILVPTLLLAAAGGLGWYAYKRNKQEAMFGFDGIDDDDDE